MLLRLLAAMLALTLTTVAAAASPDTALDRFLSGLNTWSADFSQTVVDGRGRKLGEGSGRLLISRPGKFRWELAPEGSDDAGQVLVADGRNLWFLDRDLDQVTVKPVTEALSQSPAMLLSGTGDVRKAFDVKAEAKSQGLDWALVKPRSGEGDFSSARLGFRGTDLELMELNDRLGQKTTIVFRNFSRNGAINADDLRFVPPAGADVIGKPLP